MKRDLAIDATRGLAIWSMISSHFAGGTPIAEPTHSFPYVDGMSVFVMLSGLVLGLVYRGWIERHGLGYAYQRLAKRIVVLYLCQLTIALVAVAAAMAGHRWLTRLLDIDGWSDGIWLALTMKYLPAGANILMLYMVLMMSAFLLFPLLMRGWWAPILVASLALYVAAQTVAPDWFFISAHMRSPHTENWAGWQIMFIPAVVVGWNWQRWRIPERVDRWLLAIILGAACVWCFSHYVVDTGPWMHLEPNFADKLNFAPARAVGAWVLVPAIYGIFRLMLRWWHHDWLRPLVMTGTRSLDSYVLQAIALVIVPVHIAHRPWDPITVNAAVILVFGMCWAWAEFRRAAGIDRLHRAPALLWDALRREHSALTPSPVSRRFAEVESDVSEISASEIGASEINESEEPTRAGVAR
ncbi:OpgC domain-containing protein [Gordonia sp. ABSL1-1]|uniref:OpgC domain-containing protein n=1 Tax=Gordonia sp. ABSL1-1 TaxID=3053923 RepID=UPI002572ECA0|nr:OpgC domain-containing protein [Gordonia sp. ABSL1-1]MDL9938503.1 OpgC domain-containing protein [Gordonia sp. ABSL1-1]